MGKRLRHFGREPVVAAWKLDQLGRVDAERMRQGSWRIDGLREDDKRQGNADPKGEGASHRRPFCAARQ